VAQTVLDAGATASLNVPLPAGRYRLRNLTGELSAWLVADPEGSTTSLTAALEPDGLRLTPPDSALQPGEVPLHLTNQTGCRQQVIVERSDRYQDAATAAVVSVYQEFRNLFSKELLSPTAQLGISSLALMFTDLKGSTALYAELGDVSAYSLVRDHFELLQELVGRHGGGVVKTVGDAVMAAFPTPAAAIRCALRIHADLEQFNRTASHPVRLKVGIHHGSCIAVRSYDDRLDYFGGTVNLAARTHEQSRGDDVVVSRSLWEAAEVAELVADVPAEPFTVNLRGLGEQQLVRLLPRQ
jgi:class 3 adenylate cyclase